MVQEVVLAVSMEARNPPRPPLSSILLEAGALSAQSTQIFCGTLNLGGLKGYGTFSDTDFLH
jgi:hypothetical protein